MKTVDFLKEKVPVFKQFSPDRLDKLTQDSRVSSYEANEAIAYAGEAACYFYVVLSGSVAASIIGGLHHRQ